MVVEAWIAFLGAGGQRYPGLYAVHVRPVNTHVFKSFAVRDTAARDHPVDLAGADFLFETEAVAMGDLARIKIGHGRKADMRVGDRKSVVEGKRSVRVDLGGRRILKKKKKTYEVQIKRVQ